MIAAQLGKAESVELLLQRGAAPNLRDLRGRTAADIARDAHQLPILGRLQDGAK
jgi:ankyrin repeat protein